MRDLPAIVVGALIVVALLWLYFYAPCGVFYWNNAKDIPERCHAALGRG